MRIAFVLLCLLTLCTARTQNLPPIETLTNQTVIQLHKAGLGTEVIKIKIQSSVCKFDLSTDAMITLKKSGVPDEIIGSMFTASNTSVLQATETTKPQKTALPSAEGIYYLDSATNSYVEFPPSVLTNQKSGGMGEFFKRSVSGLFNAKQRATLSGASAWTKLSRAKQQFLFVFDTTKRGFSNTTTWSSVQSPNEFFLVKMKVVKNTREIVVGKENSVSSNIGIDDALKVPFTAKPITKGVYEVTFGMALPAGEYSFMFASSSMYAGSTHKVYDFSIQ